MSDNFAKLAKYNFWNNDLPDMGLVREQYLKKLPIF